MTKVEFLKTLAKSWFGTSQQDSIHAQLLRARGLKKLADKFMAESDEEWEEAKKVNARLIELGETPEVEIEKYPVITDVKEMLEFDDDYVTKDMLQKFIIDEQEHYGWVKEHLCIIEQIGIDNYLIEQL